MRKSLISCLTVIVLASLCGPGFLTAGTIERTVVAGGGGAMAGDSQTVSATVGQPLTGDTTGSHVLSAGFWHPPAGEQTPIFLAGFSAARNDGRVSPHPFKPLNQFDDQRGLPRSPHREITDANHGNGEQHPRPSAIVRSITEGYGPGVKALQSAQERADRDSPRPGFSINDPAIDR